MNKQDIEKKIEYIKFFQNKDFIERLAQINTFEDYDNYLDYYVCEKLNPLKYLKIKLKGKNKNNNQINQLLEEINKDNYICIISSFYRDKKMDGYYKRVEQADDLLLQKYKLIYLDHTNLANREFTINKYDDKHIIINFNSFNNQHLEYIKTIINSIKKIYIHSIHNLMPDVLNYEYLDIIYHQDNKTILDLHGAVSEELKQFDKIQRADLAQMIEEITLSKSSKIICMSKAMQDYYINKYQLDLDKFITMSIMPFENIDNTIDKNNETINVIYSGGIQKWQNIDLIKEAVKSNINKYKFRIYTHESKQLIDEWSDIKNDNLIIDTKTNEEVYQEYKDMDFGFILRDDNIVNNVACPTKIMEYLGNGIIPILKTDKIGNFKEYGLQYVNIEDFKQGIIPNLQERKKMISNNYEVLAKIIQISNEGKKQILEYLN